jgi:hypothetical protein
VDPTNVPHIPEKPLQKLRQLYEAIKDLLFHLRKHVWRARDFSTERQFSALNTGDYKQVRVLHLEPERTPSNYKQVMGSHPEFCCRNVVF